MTLREDGKNSSLSLHFSECQFTGLPDFFCHKFSGHDKVLPLRRLKHRLYLQHLPSLKIHHGRPPHYPFACQTIASVHFKSSSCVQTTSPIRRQALLQLVRLNLDLNKILRPVPLSPLYATSAGTGRNFPAKREYDTWRLFLPGRYHKTPTKCRAVSRPTRKGVSHLFPFGLVFMGNPTGSPFAKMVC